MQNEHARERHHLAFKNRPTDSLGIFRSPMKWLAFVELIHKEDNIAKLLRMDSVFSKRSIKINAETHEISIKVGIIQKRLMFFLNILPFVDDLDRHQFVFVEARILDFS